jgi:prepilin-type N-terminal cleavage/methylation domain-containing protein
MSRIDRLAGSQSGYSLLEMMLVVGISGVVSAMALFEIGNARPAFKGDGAMRAVIAQLNTARALAIAQRRNIQVTFTGGNMIGLIRRNVPAANGTTVLASIPMEGGVTFALTTGVPDTPDAFGNSSAAYFTGGTTDVYFTTDGTLINASGSPVNGTVFLALSNQPRSTRAVTVMGATGRIRGFKWNGTTWIRA